MKFMYGTPDVPRFTCVGTRTRYQRDRERRGSAQDRGYDSEWSRLRGWHLKREPMCRICYFRGKLQKAEMVNHTVPIADAPELRLDKSNLSSVCQKHHDTTVRELEKLARQTGDVFILRTWLEDPSTWPAPLAFTAKGFPRLLRVKREKEARQHADRTTPEE